MRYKILGKSGLRVSELCLGTMTFGEEWGFGTDKSECKKIFEYFTEMGGNFIDTANIYTNGTSETYLGSLLEKHRHDYIIATKYSLNPNPRDPNSGGNHKKSLIQGIEGSLRRLKTDYIDLYWVHAWDFSTHPEQVMRALDDVIKSGKVLHIGISDTPAWIVSQANTIAELRGWSEFVGIQVEYNLLERTSERDLIPMANSLELAITAWSPLAGGLLTGKYKRGQKAPDNSRYLDNNWGMSRFNQKNFEIIEATEKIAEEIGHLIVQIAINFIRQKNNGSIIPIVGVKTKEQLHNIMGCLEFKLTDEYMQKLEKISEIDPGFPHAFLKTDDVKQMLYGNQYKYIDLPSEFY